MGNRALFVNDRTEAQGWLKSQGAKVDQVLSRRSPDDTFWELPDGSIIQEHDARGDQYALTLVLAGSA